MATLLLEIGTEELPGGYVPPALAQLAEIARARLLAERIAVEDIQVWGTPRRLAIFATGVSLQQAPAVREVRGPAVATAFAPNSEPTQAAIGFARSQGISVSDLRIKRIENGEFVVAIFRDEGSPTLELLPAILPQLITGLTFPKTMRWGAGSFRFARPIRWIVALLDDTVVPFVIDAVPAGRLTRGHRFLAPGEVEIPDAADYHQIMDENHVLVVPEERRIAISTQLAALTQHDGARVLDDGALLEDATFHVEYPTAVRGAFNPDFLSLPDEVLLQVMRSEQHFFPLADMTGKLLPAFLAVRNGDKAYLSNVREGYESVMHAKLLDALFFFEQDRKQPLTARVEDLRGVVFLERLGTLHDKADRLQALAGEIAEWLDLPAQDRALAVQAAMLAKADLVTAMVTEHPELQGAMGRAYAWRSGEPEAVAAAIGEQYLPRAASDPIPATTLGRITALADKVDTVTACFAAGIVPTGSEDPYELRREMTGVVRILAEAKLRLSLTTLFTSELSTLRFEDIPPAEETLTVLLSFAHNRLENLLGAMNISYAVIKAVLAVSVDTPADALARARAIEGAMDDPLFLSTVRAATRLTNIARGHDDDGLQPELLTDEAELGLYTQYETAAPRAHQLAAEGDFTGLLQLLAGLAPAIDRFFTEVLVMVDQPELRQARLALVWHLAELFRLLADLSVIG